PRPSLRSLLSLLFFHQPPPTELYTLSLHDALPILIVARVDEGSAAGEAGVQRGDVIREINRQKVRSMADYERLTRDVKEGDRLTVLLQRGQMSLYVAFTATARG